MAGIDTDVGAAVEHHVAGLDAGSRTVVDSHLLLGEMEGQEVVVAAGDPEAPVGRLPEDVAGRIFFETSAGGQDPVLRLREGSPVRGALDGLGEGAVGTPPAGHEQGKAQRFAAEPPTRPGRPCG